VCAGGYGDFRGKGEQVNLSLCLCVTVVKPIFMIPIHETASGVTFAIKVQPRARKNTVTGELGDALKVALTAPPVDGRANEACVEFFANLLKVPHSSVTIASGKTGRRKLIRVAGLSADEVRKRLAE
jgi:uncharacterized protein (TIGR00251 family)